VCQTRDISSEGCFLDTVEVVAEGTEVDVVLMDLDTGNAIELEGAVMRSPRPSANSLGMGLGIRFRDPPDLWLDLVARQQGDTMPGFGVGTVRLRIVVAGDDERRRGALALYVTSGWDVRFASDLNSATEALRGGAVDAVIAEHQLDDPRWRDILQAARNIQPNARRIVRSSLRGERSPPAGRARDLVHRVVDAQAGLDALLDALTADYGLGSSGADMLPPDERQ